MRAVPRNVLICGILSGLAALASMVGGSTEGISNTIQSAYPGLASGPLSFARLGDLPDGIVLRASSIEITFHELDAEIAKVPQALQGQVRKNAIFLLEQMVVRRLLLQAAKGHTDQAEAASPGKSEGELIRGYLQQIADTVEVTDTEIEDFYGNNRDLLGGVTLEQVKDQIKQYMLQQKRQEITSEHIRTLGLRVPIVVSASWLKEMAVLARDNPVDKARMSGKASIVDFGASGCRPCDMMTPILADLEKKYEDTLNVVFVHVRKEQILAARYDIQGIPTQVFFDRDGKEVFRHTGFFPQEDIEKKLKEMGVE